MQEENTNQKQSSDTPEELPNAPFKVKNNRITWLSVFFIVGVVILTGCILAYTSNSTNQPVEPPKNLEQEMPQKIVTEPIHLFYPMPNSETTEQQPTFFGKLFQSTEPLLDTVFSLEGVPYAQDDKSYYLTFFPGMLKNVSVVVDGIPVTAVYGVAQFPKVLCDNNSSDTWGEGGSVSSILPIPTEEWCMENKQEFLPPVLFTFKPTQRLTLGQHTVKIATDENEKEFVFTVVGEQEASSGINTQIVDDTRPFEVADSCSSRYYYPSGEYMHMPVPDYVAANQFSKIYFPQSEPETETFAEQRILYLSLGGEVFDFRLPPASTFYVDGEDLSQRVVENTKNVYLLPRHLFLPATVLVYGDGSLAAAWEGTPAYDGDTSEYVEVIPINASGEYYYANKLPHQTTSWSGCDG